MTRVKTHPGEVLREEFMKPLGISAMSLTSAIGVSRYRIGALWPERRRVDADIAIGLGRYFNTDPHFWLNLQIAHDLSAAKYVTDGPSGDQSWTWS